MNEMAETDAREFGEHVKAGGWRLGFLVARNVEVGKGHGGDRRSEDFQPGNYPVEKVAAAKFAQMAGLSDHKIVTRYLSAWDAYAADGKVPASADLSPGDEWPLDEAELGKFRPTYGEASKTSTVKKKDEGVSTNSKRRLAVTKVLAKSSGDPRDLPSPLEIGKTYKVQSTAAKAIRSEAEAVLLDRQRTGRAAPSAKQQEKAEAAARNDRIGENAYEAMRNAPPGAQNNPMFWRASKVEALINELRVLEPEVAVGQLVAPAFRFFTEETADWWSRFTMACEKRRAEETPEMSPVKHKPERAPWAESGIDHR